MARGQVRRTQLDVTIDDIVNDPSPFEPRVQGILSAMSSLSVMLESEVYEDFEGVWTQSLSQMIDLWEEMGEVKSADAVGMSMSLNRAAQGLLEHRFDDFGIAEEFFLIVSTMLGLAYGLIDFDEPMTLEKALLACQVADSISIAYSLGKQEELASWQSEMRDAILLEVLRRDPTNKIAIQLNSIHSSSESHVGELARDEVASWRWTAE